MKKEITRFVPQSLWVLGCFFTFSNVKFGSLSKAFAIWCSAAWYCPIDVDFMIKQYKTRKKSNISRLLIGMVYKKIEFDLSLNKSSIKNKTITIAKNRLQYSIIRSNNIEKDRTKGIFERIIVIFLSLFFRLVSVVIFPSLNRATT